MRFGSRREAWLIGLGLVAGGAFSLLGHSLLDSRKPEMIEEALCKEAVELVILHGNSKVQDTRRECLEFLDLLKDYRYPEVPAWWELGDGGTDL